jgi:hypothetical protein
MMTRKTPLFTALALILIAQGCSDEDREPVLDGGHWGDDGADDGDAGDAGDDGGGDTGGGGDGGDGGGDSGGDGGDSGDIKYDVQGDDGSGGPGDEEEGCSNVDVLYIIDNSPSMYDEQQTLIANFGTFSADMQAALAEVDSYHIGVITTDDFGTEGIFDDGYDTVNQSFPECQELGGLVIEAHSGSCLPFADGSNFITEADDLVTKFSCIANVGEDGDSDEKVGDALIAMIQSQVGNNNVSACNEGFFRTDALLVLVILTDENDVSSTGPTEWYQAVVAAKGFPEHAVVLALTWSESEVNCNQDLSETTGYTIEEFAEMFPHHATGNICDDSYAGFFSSTLPVIETACDEFQPEG